MHSNLSGPTKAVCSRDASTIRVVCRPVARLNYGGVLLDQSGTLRYVNGHCG